MSLFLIQPEIALTWITTIQFTISFDSLLTIVICPFIYLLILTFWQLYELTFVTFICLQSKGKQIDVSFRRRRNLLIWVIAKFDFLIKVFVIANNLTSIALLDLMRILTTNWLTVLLLSFELQQRRLHNLVGSITNL